MKTLFYFFFLSLMCLSLNSQDLQPSEVYRLHYHKFKHGSENRATEIGKSLFSKALNMAGTGHAVLKAETGPWDLLVIIPMDPDEPHQNLNNDLFMENMLKISGTDEALKIQMDEFNSLVQDEEMYYYRGQTKFPLDNSKYYRSRHIKCTSGNITEATNKGMKFLNGALENLGTNNLVLKAISGPDDIVIVEPMMKENIFSNSAEYSKKWGEALRKTGSQEELSAFFARWGEMVQREDLHYFTNINGTK